MPTRVDTGTDIATIGIWDPVRERHDLSNAKSADYEAALRSEARAGRLFYINTGGDGGYPVDIFVDESPEADLLDVYTTIDPPFLIISESGRLIAGGVEDFVSATKRITSPKDEVPVPAGRYALTLHQLDEEKLAANLERTIGDEDYAYYEQRSSGIPWGCLLFVIAIVVLLLQYWILSISLVGVWVAYLLIRTRMRSADVRLQDISARIAEFQERFPKLLFVLRPIADQDDLSGGWHDLA